jgi:hypothetical protein
MTRSSEHTARLSHQRKNMPGLAQILRIRLRRNGSFHGVRAVVRRYSGGYTLGRLDGQRKVGAMRAVGVAHHERQTQLVAAFARQGQANEAAAIARHEVDVFGAHALGCHDEIALIFAILIVHQHRHLAGPEVIENLIDRIESTHG